MQSNVISTCANLRPLRKDTTSAEVKKRRAFTNIDLKKQVKQVYNDQPLGISALGKIEGGYGSLVSVVSRVCPWLPRNGPWLWLSRCGSW